MTKQKTAAQQKPNSGVDSKDHNKDKILAAASALFVEGGAAALNVRAIAKRAGVSTIGIYSHFDGKQGILDALYIEGFEKVRAAVDMANAADQEEEHLRKENLKKEQPQPSTARQTLFRAGQRYLQVAIDHEAHYRLIFGEPVPGYLPSEAARDTAARAFRALTELVASALPDDSSAESVDDCALLLWSFLHGTASLRNHSISGLIDTRHWQENALRAMDALLDQMPMVVEKS